MLSITSAATLNNGVKMPLLGLGVYMITGYNKVEQVISTAYAAGYRHIDTAKFYNNEKDIGDAIKKLKIPREELFITSKLWYTDHGYESTIAACNASLKRLGMDYMDLYLVHWPGTDGEKKSKSIRKETWRAMQDLYKQGKCKAIGVSNYTIAHLQEILQDPSNVVPAVNQVEMHPKLTQKELLQFCNSKGILLTAYSPLAKGELINNSTLKKIGSKYDKTVAQVIVRYFLQQNVVVIPKSEKAERIKENANVYNFDLSAEDMKLIDSLNEDYHCTWDPSDVQ